MTQKSAEIEDLRVRRTRKMLQQAFLELTVKKGFAALTVRDITERAMVNRSTFYRHYLDKYDLLEQYMEEIYDLTEDRALLLEEPEPDSHEVPSGLLSLLKHIQIFANFYRVMLGPQGDPLFAQRFRQNTEKRFHSMLAQANAVSEPNAPPIDMRINCIAHAGVGATVWWLQQEQPCPPEQLAIWMCQLSSAIADPSPSPQEDKVGKY